MSVSTFFHTIGNTQPTFSITLQRNSVAIPLTSASGVKFIIKHEINSGVTATSTVAITDAVNGIVGYTPGATDFDVAGRYTADAVITYTDLTTEDLYEQALFIVRKKAA